MKELLELIRIVNRPRPAPSVTPFNHVLGGKDCKLLSILPASQATSKHREYCKDTTKDRARERVILLSIARNLTINNGDR